MHALHTRGMAGLEKQSTRPQTVAPVLEAVPCDALQHSLHHSPRADDQPRGGGTLALAAAGCEEQGVTECLLRDATIRRALQRLHTPWKRAQHWITRPAPHDARKKGVGSLESTRVGAS